MSEDRGLSAGAKDVPTVGFRIPTFVQNPKIECKTNWLRYLIIVGEIYKG